MRICSVTRLDGIGMTGREEREGWGKERFEGERGGIEGDERSRE